jgi:hypothetical protein
VPTPTLEALHEIMIANNDNVEKDHEDDTVNDRLWVVMVPHVVVGELVTVPIWVPLT